MGVIVTEGAGLGGKLTDGAGVDGYGLGASVVVGGSVVGIGEGGIGVVGATWGERVGE